MATFQLNEVIRLYEPSQVKRQRTAAGVAFAASIQHLSDPATVDLPQDGSVAIDGLPQLKGYSCMSCRYMTINRDNAVAHQRTEAHTVVGGPGWTVVTLQSFGQRKHARYWVVKRDGAVGDRVARALGGLASSLRACEEILEKEAAERRKTVEEVGTVTSRSRWVTYMGWIKHLRQANRVVLREAGFLPLTAAAECKERDRAKVDDNRRMRLLGDSFERELRRSAQRVDRVPTQSLKWLASVDPTKPVGKPFDVKETEETWQFYCSQFQRYLCYCVRV
ncbi:hypothetical protein B0H66DRAFT_605369 [Apodospora peruviana]|uniref:C2H2-type domain-containing protein n=1 Tax=Apodospora peruviana TaxID=516989 RepID=A0AAE0I1X4_9PEZI|nr:hypothetical protein B0H66DRAFT_605369 [Apodospora peruviana]